MARRAARAPTALANACDACGRLICRAAPVRRSLSSRRTAATASETWRRSPRENVGTGPRQRSGGGSAREIAAGSAGNFKCKDQWRDDGRRGFSEPRMVRPSLGGTSRFWWWARRDVSAAVLWGRPRPQLPGTAFTYGSSNSLRWSRRLRKGEPARPQGAEGGLPLSDHLKA